MDFEDGTFIKQDNVFIPSEERHQQTDLKWKHALRQIMASSIAISVTIPAGVNLSFSAILLPQLYNSDDIPITTSEASWIASLVTISLPLGTILTGVLMDRFGRKKINMFCTLPFAVAWIVNATARNVGTIYFARLLAGFASGLTTVATIYISEITHPNYRPMLLSLVSVYISLGILLTCLLGYWCHWRTMCYIFFVLQVVILGTLLLLPESPYWLAVFRKDPEAASRSLSWIYRDQQIFDDENRRFHSVELKKPGASQRKFRIFHWRSYSSPVIYKPFLILSFVFVIQQLTGAYVIIFYAIDVFGRISRVSKNSISEELALVLLGVIRFVASVVAAIISKRIGRKVLLFVSGAGMCVFSLIISVYMYLKEGEEDYNQSIPLICILSYVCLGSIGYLLIPWTLIGELLPIEARGKLGSFLIGLAYVYMFGVLKVFPFLLNAARLPTVFCGLAVVNVCGVCFVQYYLPETLGKRFSDIEKYFA